MYEKARDVYEEGMTTVTTVRDFSLIFDTLTQFEESLLTHKMQQAAEDGEESEEEDITPEQKGGIDFLQQEINAVTLSSGRPNATSLLLEPCCSLHFGRRRTGDFKNGSKSPVTCSQCETASARGISLVECFVVLTGCIRNVLKLKN